MKNIKGKNIEKGMKARITIDGKLPKTHGRSCVGSKVHGQSFVGLKTHGRSCVGSKTREAFCSKEQAFGLSRGALKAAAAAFAARSSARIGVPFRAVTVILQDDAASDAAHRAIMNVVGATDVITQRYEAIPPEPEGIYGELYVNVDQARRAAPKRRGWTAEKELLLYVAHGMDHLSGADDHSPADYAKMRRRELLWLRDVLRSGFGTSSDPASGRRLANTKATPAAVLKGTFAT